MNGQKDSVTCSNFFQQLTEISGEEISENFEELFLFLSWKPKNIKDGQNDIFYNITYSPLPFIPSSMNYIIFHDIKIPKTNSCLHVDWLLKTLSIRVSSFRGNVQAIRILMRLKICSSNSVMSLTIFQNNYGINVGMHLTICLKFMTVMLGSSNLPD